MFEIFILKLDNFIQKNKIILALVGTLLVGLLGFGIYKEINTYM